MSTKELYTALLTARMDEGQQMIHQTDEAIRKCIQAEQDLNSMNTLNGDLVRRRLKLILCEEAAKRWNPIKPTEVSGSETEQLQKLADAVGCPKLTAWLEKQNPVFYFPMGPKIPVDGCHSVAIGYRSGKMANGHSVFVGGIRPDNTAIGRE